MSLFCAVVGSVLTPVRKVSRFSLLWTRSAYKSGDLTNEL